MLALGAAEAWRFDISAERRHRMKHVILLIASLSVSSSAVVGQSGHAGQEKNLRGLKGLRLVVMFARADAIDEAERPAILSILHKLSNGSWVLVRDANLLPPGRDA
jgi:hypothetical protein